MNILNVIMTAVITFCVIAVALDLKRGEKMAAIRDAAVLALVVILCAFVLMDAHQKTQPLDDAPQEILVHDDGILRIYARKPGTEGSPIENPPANPKDPTNGRQDLGRNIDAGLDTDTNNGIDTATSMHQPKYPPHSERAFFLLKNQNDA